MNNDKSPDFISPGQSPGHIMIRYLGFPLLAILSILAFLLIVSLQQELISVEAGIVLYTLALLLSGVFLIRLVLLKLKKNSRLQELESKLRERTTELEQANKDMESFSYSVSHDLRGPLRSIRGYAELLKEDYEKVLDEEGLLYLSLLSNTTIKLSTQIEDLLAFTRIGKHEMNKTVVNMHALTEAVWEELSVKKTYAGQIKIHNLPKSQADEAMMRIVLLHIISNALKFTAKKIQANIEIGAVEQGVENIYYVKDDGAGFNMKYVHKLFNAFERLHNMNEYEGTGVGLAIVKRIILKHGGKVWAEGVEEQGACFYFSLPK